MTARASSATPASSGSSGSSPPFSLDTFLAISPLAPGEDEAAYGGLRAAMFRDLQPTSPVEAIWVRDVVDLSWELQRLERVRTRILTRGRHAVLERLLYEGLKYNAEAYRRTKALIARWVEGDPTALTHVEALLARKGYDGTLLVTEAYEMSLSQIEALDCMRNRARLRRNRLLADIDRRRRDFARRMRAALASLTSPPSHAAPQPARAASPPGVVAAAAPAAPNTSLSDPIAPAPDGIAPASPPASPPPRDERMARAPDAAPEDERLGRRPDPMTHDSGAPEEALPRAARGGA